MNHFFSFLALLSMLPFSASAGDASEALTYPDLVKRMHDPKRLATFPAKGETSGSFSSCDRGSRYDEEEGKYVYWHANNDGGGYLDKDGTMMALEGPGVIWRIWSAMPKEGNVEFYIDGAEKPWTLPFIDLFAAKPYSEFPELVHIKARGNNFFIPIPFQDSIRIRGDEGWGKYYQITYTKFPRGTKVPSWNGSLNEEAKAALAKANDVWGERGPGQFVTPDTVPKRVAVTLEPGQSKPLAVYDKEGAIVSIVMDRPKMDRDASVEILRELSIAITWDDDPKPSVWAPIGDFFGTGAGENRYRTLLTGMTDRSYYANWYMPFEKASIVVANDGKETRTLSFTIHTEPLAADASELLRFHCKWHRDDFTGFDEEQLWNERWPDWPVLSVDGTPGRFCGFMAHMWNPNHIWDRKHRKENAKPYPTRGAFEDINSPQFRFFEKHVITHKYWWGEGDEKFFVDGEKMPSTFGTGTEDYFGYAWGTAEAFDSALQGQPRNGAADEIGKKVDHRYRGNTGHIVNVRWQLQDNVPFQRSIEATVEKYHPNSWPLLNAYTVAWYQAAGNPSPYNPVLSVEERSGYFVEARPDTPPAIEDGRYDAGVPGHIKNLGQHFRRYSGALRQGMEPGKGWTADRQWLIRLEGPNSHHQFSFHVSEALANSTRRASIGLSRSPEFGIVDILIDDRPVAERIDCYGEQLAPGLKVDLANLKLSPGEHRLMIRSTGKSEKSKGYWAGLDYIQLQSDIYR